MDNKNFDSHRRLNEIGGILLGVGLGLVLAKHVSSSGGAFIGVVSAVVGFGILFYEQKKWNKEKDR